MKKRMFRNGVVRAALSMLGMATLLSSCKDAIFDNLDDCPPPYNVRLLVVTDYEKAQALRTRGTYELIGDAEFDRHGAGWYRDRIDNVTVYVFDENDRYVTSWTGPEYKLGEEYAVPFMLEEGRNYHFTAWTNSGTTYTPSHAADILHGGVSRDELYMRMEMPDDDTFTSDIPHRHHGTLNIRPVAAGVNDYEIVIDPHTYKVNFIVRDLPAGTAPGLFEVEVEDSNSRHYFDLANTGHPQIYRHIRTLASSGMTYEGNTLAQDEIGASMILLQIGDDTGTAFSLSNMANWTDVDLLRTIGSVYAGYIDPNDPDKFNDLEDMLENKYEYTIILQTSSTTDPNGNAIMDMELVIHDWNYKDNPTHL